MRSRRPHTRHIASHNLNAQKVINWKRYFKENLIRKYLGERITKEVVVIRIESYFFLRFTEE